MDRDYFSQIAQAILKQKQRMEQLEAENRELRRYLDDLRTGRGIFVEISGRRFPLRDILSPGNPSGIPG
jgi:cell division protein FtsB